MRHVEDEAGHRRPQVLDQRVEGGLGEVDGPVQARGSREQAEVVAALREQPLHQGGVEALGAKTASAMPCGGSWLKFREAVPKAMSRSAMTVGTLAARDGPRQICATVEAPMPPRTPNTEMVRPMGFTRRR